MAKLFEEAKAYEPQQTKNIADLEEVSVDLDIEDDEFEFTDKDGNSKVVKQKVALIGKEKYRVPNSVLHQLKVMLEDSPTLKKFKVKRAGSGLNTEYIVIPINKI